MTYKIENATWVKTKLFQFQDVLTVLSALLLKRILVMEEEY